MQLRKASAERYLEVITHGLAGKSAGQRPETPTQSVSWYAN